MRRDDGATRAASASRPPERPGRLRDEGGRLAAFRGHRPAVLALILILLIAAIALMAPLFAPADRDAIDLDSILASPSREHVLGTDELGRDVLTRLIYGARASLLVAIASVAVAAALGIGLGALAGYFGGAADAVVTVVIDCFVSIPVFLVLLVASGAAGGSLLLIPLVIGGTAWMETARIVRIRIRSLRGAEFVEAARAAGARDASLMIRHLLPLAVAPAIVAAATGFSQAMLAESALSFLGFGVQAPVPTWGNMLQNAQVFLREAPLLAFVPGFMIFITCLAWNFLGDGVRRALAPRRES